LTTGPDQPWQFVLPCAVLTAHPAGLVAVVAALLAAEEPPMEPPPYAAVAAPDNNRIIVAGIAIFRVAGLKFI
jgi:hypothetical protein